MKKNLLLLVLVLSAVVHKNSLAQGGDLLIQQYSKGPQLDWNYSKWVLSAGPQLYRMNTDMGTTSPTLTFGGILELEYRLSKNVGVIIGGQYNPITYTFIEKDSLRKNRLKYLGYPLLLRLQPTSKVSFSLGGIYQVFWKGEKYTRTDIEELKLPYPDGIFKNSFGVLVQASYHLNYSLRIFMNYAWIRRSSPPTQIQTNNVNGFQLGLTFSFFRSNLQK